MQNNKEKGGALRLPQELQLRTLSAIVLYGAIIAALFAGSSAFHVFPCVLAGVLLYEWGKALKLLPLVIGSYEFLFLYYVLFNNSGTTQKFFGILLFFIANAVFFFFLKKNKKNIVFSVSLKSFLLFTVGQIYIFLPLFTLDKSYLFQGKLFVLWIFLCIGATDTGAFFVGRFLKGPKLAPRISPHKTWSGFCGGLMVAEIVGFLYGAFFLRGHFSLATLAGLTFIISVAAHLGDLVESAAKRALGLKDMGSIIPGHGGAADRFDSLLMVGLVLSFLRLWNLWI
ncbi:phosphatidate cytidylyltransferase [Alphaproteobacteria bacterium]|nr:phosphatidate cytidylyltransferase [Alphaproteobacteria bacterium]GHS98707.1 phosphatidate cytidylyltransferase [Alphaproteobacteria bacterium]